MRLRRVLIANRGEVAVRIARTAAELGIESVAVHTADEPAAAHLDAADRIASLPGRGAAGYLDIEAIVAAASEHECDCVHPGYGFLSERADFARACAAAGLTFIGPGPDTLERFGDKAAARALAIRCGVPVLPGTDGAADLSQLEAFFVSLPAGSGVMIKAVAGGGGRGMRPVTEAGALAAAYDRCRSEAQAAFGSGQVYAERYLPAARHLEVQVLGDSTGAVVVLGDRDCSVQRRHQKLVEVAPAAWLDAPVRAELHRHARELAVAAGVTGLTTIEFLVPIPADGSPGTEHFFIEANARLQVEHTVTEAVTGLDLVGLQFAVAEGRSLGELGLDLPPAELGFAVQVRVCAERYERDGSVLPTGGTLSSVVWPSGLGVRVDAAVVPGAELTAVYDSLLAKVIVHVRSGGMSAAMAKARRALDELRLDGVRTNASILSALVAMPAMSAGPVATSYFDTVIASLVHQHESTAEAPSAPGGHRVGLDDPLAVLSAAAPVATRGDAPTTTGGPTIVAPVPGTIVAVLVSEGATVGTGGVVMVIESMKMEHEVVASEPLVVDRVLAAVGDSVGEGRALVGYQPTTMPDALAAVEAVADLDALRPDLLAVVERHRVGSDEARPDSVARRRATGQRTARENIADLVDPGSFVEFAPLVVAAQRRRRTLDDLIARTPADGLVGGIGRVNAARYGDRAASVVALTYDYTVLAGTQGLQNHRKKDRLFELAEELRLPVVLFAEGGGGRPGDTDGIGVAGLDCLAFHLFGRLSGLVPLVGITSGYCFAGNAALLGTCDVVIATAGSNIGMGGPAMIEGGGLGVFHPSEVGPTSVQTANGVIDILVEDEAAAVAAARTYLGYFQGPDTEWACGDQRILRTVIPENRLRVYDIRRVVDATCDEGSVLELRRGFGPGMVTTLARIEGRPVGVVANDPTHLGGAIDADAADKAARFMQLCDAYDIPLVFLCDTPGFMVGPDAEAEALVRKAARLFVTSASLTVPFMTVVLRKGYGLGAQAMAGGSFRAPLFTIAWPTGEFGGMGLEGAVKLGYRKELEAIEDPEARRAAFDEMVARMYEHGKALNAASLFEIDEVIDPADTRRWISTMLAAAPPAPARSGKKRPCVDTW